MRKTPSRPTAFRLFLSRRRKLVISLLLIIFAAIGCVHFELYKKIPTAWLANVSKQPFLQIKKIDITGATLTNEEPIRRALPCHIGQSMLSCDVSTAQQQIKTLPFVGDVTIYRKPAQGEVLIHITERNPYAIWQNHGEFSLIDRDGQKVPDKGIDDKDGIYFTRLPLVVGYKANEDNNDIIDAIISLPTIRSHVVAAIRINERRWNLLLKDGARVLLPEGKEASALRYLAQLDDKTAILDRPLSWIDLRLPDRITVQKQHEDTAQKPEGEEHAQPQTASSHVAPPHIPEEKPSPKGNEKSTAPPPVTTPVQARDSWHSKPKDHIVSEDIIDDDLPAPNAGLHP